MWTVYGSATDEFQAACPVSLFVRFSVPRTSSPLASLLSASDQRPAQSLTRAQHREPEPTQCARTRTARRPSARGKQGHESRTVPVSAPTRIKERKTYFRPSFSTRADAQGNIFSDQNAGSDQTAGSVHRG